MNYELHLGDCFEVMPTLPANSIDSIVCDPPYGYRFMGANWDRGVPGVPFWEAALRVAKPGAMLLAFGGTRTHHRLMVAIEDAGWEIRDCLMWLYASGFPKSHDISKAIDKTAGAEREVIGPKLGPDGQPYSQMRHMKPGTMHEGYDRPCKHDEEWRNKTNMATAPATPEAAQWQGWHSALKPSWEPIIMAMKPLDGTYANNALTHGVAGLAIDQCRIGTNGGCKSDIPYVGGDTENCYGLGLNDQRSSQVEGLGRWPANLILDEAAAALLDEQSGDRPTGGPGFTRKNNNSHVYSGPASSQDRATVGYEDTATGASRFFFCAKASSRERNEGLQGMEKRKVETMNSFAHPSEGRTADKNGGPKANTHPTVKPLELLKYLCRLTKTPFGGTVLDPFMGSGSTGCAAVLEGRSFVGIEISAEYYALAQKRLEQASVQPMLFEVSA